uniref:Uncharacterized protein n=1 Tax=Arundo donax TaxID=35708 RepID=A0A0A9AL05_ARUDO
MICHFGPFIPFLYLMLFIKLHYREMSISVWKKMPEFHQLTRIKGCKNKNKHGCPTVFLKYCNR